VAVNCAAIPEELLESELFGYKKGAFTGAAADRAGLFEEADGGTLFLDEIGEMPLSLQAKLTRALEESAVRRVGASEERRVDVRLVAATHRDLTEMVGAGAFREDLFYRLNVAMVHIPPLRDRQSDVELLAAHFLQRGVGNERRTGFTPAALDALREFSWPGNVRQLRAAVERATVVGVGDRVDVGDLPPEIHRADREPGTERSDLTWAEAQKRGRADAAREYLESVLSRFDGNVSEAATHAGVERESFYRLLRRYGLDSGGRRPKSDPGGHGE